MLSVSEIISTAELCRAYCIWEATARPQTSMSLSLLVAEHEQGFRPPAFVLCNTSLMLLNAKPLISIINSSNLEQIELA